MWDLANISSFTLQKCISETTVAMRSIMCYHLEAMLWRPTVTKPNQTHPQWQETCWWVWNYLCNHRYVLKHVFSDFFLKTSSPGVVLPLGVCLSTLCTETANRLFWNNTLQLEKKGWHRFEVRCRQYPNFRTTAKMSISQRKGLIWNRWSFEDGDWC